MELKAKFLFPTRFCLIRLWISGGYHGVSREGPRVYRLNRKRKENFSEEKGERSQGEGKEQKSLVSTRGTRLILKYVYNSNLGPTCSLMGETSLQARSN